MMVYVRAKETEKLLSYMEGVARWDQAKIKRFMGSCHEATERSHPFKTLYDVVFEGDSFVLWEDEAVVLSPLEVLSMQSD